MIPYLVTVDDVLGFLEASARPVPAWRVVLNPATVGGVGDVCEGFVKCDGGHWCCLSCAGMCAIEHMCLLVVLYHVPVSFAYALMLLLVAAVYFTHHKCHHERVNAGNGAACGVSRDGNGRS